MSGDVFGNLREWDRVPAQIDELTRTGKLDEHQEGLARILRYRDNWRLREMVLKSIGELEAPSDEIISGALDIMMDDAVYFEARILAADVLRDLIARNRIPSESGRPVNARTIAEKMEIVLDSPEPPVVHEAVRRCLTAMQKAESAR